MKCDEIKVERILPPLYDGPSDRELSGKAPGEFRNFLIPLAANLTGGIAMIILANSATDSLLIAGVFCVLIALVAASTKTRDAIFYIALMILGLEWVICATPHFRVFRLMPSFLCAALSLAFFLKHWQVSWPIWPASGHWTEDA